MRRFFLFVGVFSLFFLSPFVSFAKGTELLLFADSAFHRPTRTFVPNQTVFVKLDTLATGEEKMVFEVASSVQDHLFFFPTQETSHGFQGEFTAPSTPGIYLVHAELKDSSHHINTVVSFTVEGEKEETTVHIETKTESTAQVKNTKRDVEVGDPQPIKQKQKKGEREKVVFEETLTSFVFSVLTRILHYISSIPR